MALEALNTQASLTMADDSWVKGKRSKRPRSSDSPMTEEDYLAFCLILLAQGGANAVDEEGPVFPSAVDKVPELTGNSHTCVECGKSFSSYQALGGHKASHRQSSSDARKKDKASAVIFGSVNHVADGKVHECGICHMVFSSGQALGGHKRRHFEGKVVPSNKRSQGVDKSPSASEEESRSRSRSEGNISLNDRSNLFDLNSFPAETTTEEDDLFCRETAKEVLSAVLPSPAKRPKLLCFDV